VATSLLGLRVRNSPAVYMSVCYVVVCFEVEVSAST
jgi:hypothetical protein